MDADVIVAGAGAAGLAAARNLARQSLSVILLEARDRTGGRVWSRPLGPNAEPAELGAEFIHGRAAETMALLKEAGLPAVETGGDSWVCENGTLRVETGDTFFEAAQILAQSRDLPHDESVDRFLRRFEANESMRDRIAAARAFVEGFEAADPAIASAQSIAEELNSGVDSSSARPAGGYGPMFAFLFAACERAGVQTRLSTAVRRISWQRGSVTVDTQAAGGHTQTVRARAAVITLPAGVLRNRADGSDVAFTPELPESKRAALDSIDMGHVVKVVLAFRTPFWKTLANGRYRDGGFFRCSGQEFAVYWTPFPQRSAMIVAWTGGPKAAALSGLSEEALVERALHGFGSLFGESALARSEFAAGAAHDWGRDPFARGAYSYVLAGAGPARAKLAQPVDETLFFAGEACSTIGQGGTVNGGLETGERAAREAAASLRSRHGS